jgi:hypothetical protein
MSTPLYGRRPDHDAICKRCRADGHETHGPSYGQAWAYYKAPARIKGRKATPAEWFFICAFHGVEVEVVGFGGGEVQAAA